MMEAAVEMALDPVPYRHMVVRRQHPKVHQFRYCCPCGWWSEWFNCTPWTEFTEADPDEFLLDHPHGIVTVSRTDLTPIPHPSNGGM